MPSVFLSYSHEDLPLIEQLETQLKNHPEISIWRDQEKIYGGQKWPKVLGEAIADQDVFLLAWSKNSSASHFVELEWNTAIALRKTIVPCLLDETVLAPILSALHGYRLDDVSGLINTLSAAPLADAQSRKPVLDRLGEIVDTETQTVLKQAKTIFTMHRWIVQGDFYQVAGDFHYHAAPKLREPVLRGRVFCIEDNDELVAAADVSLTLMQTAAKTRSDADGLFTLPLPAIFQPGTKVDVGIKKDEWAIHFPIDGEIIIPALDSELIRIRLVKKGSLKLWSAERIEKFIRDTVQKSKEQVRPEGKPQEIDFSRYIKEWAVKYGFSAQQAKAEIDKWVAEAEQKDDPYQLGLAAYAKKNFGEAGKLFEESAAEKARRAHDAAAITERLTEEAIRDFRLAGDAHTNNYHFDQALIGYQKARELTSRGQNPALWADLTLSVGNAEREIGIRTGADRIHDHLGNAEAAYRAALKVHTKDALAQPWAMTHTNLANAARSLEDWSTAAESYRNVLTIYPDYTEAYQAANTVYHEKLFDYALAFDTTRQWLERHPNHLAAQANFAEAHLTTGHYGEAERQLGELLKKPDLDPNAWVGLRIVDIVTALALKKASAIPQKLQDLQALVSTQPESFHADWSFDGTTHFVQTEQAFARYRTWLMDLFAIVQSKDRAALLAALDRVQASFKPCGH